jgi:enamine deaminase RidA (YjgF/YER057c/UK114 family)
MTARRQLISSGGPFEAKAGYSRAVRVGDYVAVAGTAAYKDGRPYAPGDAVAQTRYILEVIERALREAGATFADVIRYRIFVTDIADFPAISAEFGRVFADIRPAGTLVGISELVDPALKVEIEMDAIAGSGSGAAAEEEEPVSPDQTSS